MVIIREWDKCPFNKNSFCFKSSLKSYMPITENPKNTTSRKRPHILIHKGQLHIPMWYLFFLIHMFYVIFGGIISSLLSCPTASYHCPYPQLCAEPRGHSCTLLIIMPGLGFIVSSFHVFPFLFSSFSPFSFALPLAV